MSKGNPIALPEEAPKAGEVYRHYKQSDLYKVIGMAINSGDKYYAQDEWMVVYEPMYEDPAAPLFVKLLKEWQEAVEWEGRKMDRFVKTEQAG